jgi:hypothetical protein
MESLPESPSEIEVDEEYSVNRDGETVSVVVESNDGTVVTYSQVNR